MGIEEPPSGTILKFHPIPELPAGSAEASTVAALVIGFSSCPFLLFSLIKLLIHLYQLMYIMFRFHLSYSNLFLVHLCCRICFVSSV